VTPSLLEVLISSWYLDPLKTPDIGKISAVISRGRDQKARNYTCRVRTNLRLNKGSNGKYEGRDGDVGVYFSRNSIVLARVMTIEYS
jgi:hypothetical protein